MQDCGKITVDDRWILIELKYKAKGCNKKIGSEVFVLKNHGAKDINCYLYLKDLQRIESIRDTALEFLEGYTIFLTKECATVHGRVCLPFIRNDYRK